MAARPPRSTEGFDTKPTGTDILSTICVKTLSCLEETKEENPEICLVAVDCTCFHFQSSTALLI